MELIKSPVYITDDVERSMLVLQIVPELLTLDDHTLNLFGCGEFEDMPKALTLQVAH